MSIHRLGVSLRELVLTVFLAVSENGLAESRKGSDRCFVIMVSSSEDKWEIRKDRGEVWRIGKKAEDISALQKGLSALGEVRIVKLKNYSVVFVKLGHLETKALDQIIHIDSFTGSPAGLLVPIAKESGADWARAGMFSLPNNPIDTLDYLTRITVTDFRGSIRQLLAETIPPSYGSLAFDIRCFPNGRIEVTQPGAAQVMEWQFRADHVSGALPTSVILSPDEREKESAVIYKRSGGP